MTSLANNPIWQNFHEAVKLSPIATDDLRIIQAASLSVDLSTQRYSAQMASAAQALLEMQDFDRLRAQLFDGSPISWTENRAAWHTALRATTPPTQVAELIEHERARMLAFVEQANSKNQYRNVVHLGIGGSDWGPRLVVESLAGLSNRRNLRFASNVDAHAITAALEGLDQRDTLIIVASKSFTTTESLANAACAMDWLRAAGIQNPLDHFVAVTANPKAAQDFGIKDEHIFQFWDWVGGRYSIWSSIGLPIALGLGADQFQDLLAGAAAMDEHFLTASTATNAPVQMALSGVANRSVLGYASFALCPYDARLKSLVPWLQQLEMESLGKGVTRTGETLDVPSSPAVWGMPGTDSQHTFFQWLHQDNIGAPVDFVLCAKPDHRYNRHHRLLIANCLAQRAALWQGKPIEKALAEVRRKENDTSKVMELARHRVHPGGRPSTLIVLPQLDAKALGALLALYEHKVFTQGVIWGINPFDQWGVEFGKQVASDIERRLDALGSDPEVSPYDASTAHWVRELAGGR
jgi:glucose-6-phosphate isomerase